MTRRIAARSSLRVSIALVAIAGLALHVLAPRPARADAQTGAPPVGAPAPDFALVGSDGRTYSLADFAGRRGVVLAWFPKAFTPGCTRELEALRDGAALLAPFEADVFMVSLDAPEQNRAFAASLGADVVLLSDATGLTASAYGVAGPGSAHAKRWTFYIDRDGVLRAVDTNVDVADAAGGIARRLAELGFPRRDEGAKRTPDGGGGE